MWFYTNFVKMLVPQLKICESLGLCFNQKQYLEGFLKGVVPASSRKRKQKYIRRISYFQSYRLLARIPLKKASLQLFFN